MHYRVHGSFFASKILEMNKNLCYICNNNSAIQLTVSINPKKIISLGGKKMKDKRKNLSLYSCTI